MQATAHGDNITVIPHPLKAILYSTRPGIRHPEDLQGKRIGVERGDTVTGGVRSQHAADDITDMSTITTTATCAALH